jgi:hypothetical protein
MYNMHSKLNKYYHDHVRLKDERKELAQYRDRNVERLEAGLEKLDLPKMLKHVDQGSFAMHTINQHPDKKYDIDHAIIFNKDDLPSTALGARNRIEAAMREGGGNFAKPPEAKANAVRVYYAEGHHVDLAIYRTYKDGYGNEICEHAGPEWTKRDPMDITNWFNNAVISRSPSGYFVSVDGNQLRRVVRWHKAFAKSREYWDLPGGLTISVLAEECYQSDNSQDDIALYNTMVAILARLKVNKDVFNPVDRSQSLTERPVDQGRVQRFCEKLEMAIAKLGILNNSSCTESEAMDAWYWVFQHPFWSVDENQESADAAGKRFGQAALNNSLYVAPSGQIFTTKPNSPVTQAPPQKFFGTE